MALLPKKCLLCHENCDHINLCHDCEKELPWLNAQHYPLLPFCHKTIALFHYEYPVDHMITRLKFQQQLIYAKLLGDLLTKYIRSAYRDEDLPQLIIPVPLHKKRLQERGFNQALEIAKPIAKSLQLTINKFSCVRNINTLPQSSLPASARKNNIYNAFTLCRPIHASHVAILDDVVTTGQTVKELARILYANGVKIIDIWCCARTTIND